MTHSSEAMVAVFAADEQTFMALAAQLRAKLPTIDEMMASDEATMIETSVPAALVHLLLLRCECLASTLRLTTMASSRPTLRFAASGVPIVKRPTNDNGGPVVG